VHAAAMGPWLSPGPWLSTAAVSHPGGPAAGGVFWAWVVVPLVLAGLFTLAAAASLVILRLPVRLPPAGLAAPWWATDVPDRQAALTAVAAAERCLHAGDPLLPRALFVLRCARSPDRQVAAAAGRD
jgi:hypothetical protein